MVRTGGLRSNLLSGCVRRNGNESRHVYDKNATASEYARDRVYSVFALGEISLLARRATDSVGVRRYELPCCV